MTEMTQKISLIALKFLIPRFPKDIDAKAISLMLRNVFAELRMVKPQSLQRLADEEPKWILWADDLTDDVDMKKFAGASMDWLALVWTKKIPATEETAKKYLQKSLLAKTVKGKSKPQSLVVNQLFAPRDAGPESSEKLDDASWHYEGDFPPDLEIDSAYTHIGFYLTWICINGLYSSGFFKENKDVILGLCNRDVTPGGISLLIDGKIYTEMLCQKAASFSLFYYGSDNKYYDDLDSICKKFNLPSIYHLVDSWENYDKLSKLIGKAFAKWEKSAREGK
jgi:hypothetical protein